MSVNLFSFYDAQNKPSNNIIPNNFFQTYRTSLIDDEHASLLKFFREANSDFNFYFFDDQKMDEYMLLHWRHRKIYKIYKSSIYGASKADIWRYCILYQFGGVYLDFDSHIKFKLNTIPRETEEIISFENNFLSEQISEEYTPNFEEFKAMGCIENGLIYPKNIALNWLLVFKKEHPLLLKVIENIELHSDFFIDREFESVLHAVTNCTGPVMFTRSLWEYVEKSKTVNQCGIDFDGQAIFKAIPPNGTYATDQSRYANYSNARIIDSKKYC